MTEPGRYKEKRGKLGLVGRRGTRAGELKGKQQESLSPRGSEREARTFLPHAESSWARIEATLVKSRHFGESGWMVSPLIV